jgi:methionyl-tRNA formyltransferase
MNHHVILLSPNPYSNLTIATATLLLRNGISIDAVIVRNIFSYRRFISEYRRSGKRFLHKIYRKLILRASENKSGRDRDNIIEFMRKNNITNRSIYQIAKAENLPIFTATTFNDGQTHTALDKYKPSCCVFTGGGIIKAKTLSKSGLGIINCHMGILPDYRGMDVVEWPILENRFDTVGLTTHLMDTGIDTGPILKTRHIDPGAFNNISDLRNALESKMPELLTSSCLDLLSQKIYPTPQDQTKGKHYYTINPQLRNLINQKLNYPPISPS